MPCERIAQNWPPPSQVAQACAGTPIPRATSAHPSTSFGFARPSPSSAKATPNMHGAPVLAESRRALTTVWGHVDRGPMRKDRAVSREVALAEVPFRSNPRSDMTPLECRSAAGQTPLGRNEPNLNEPNGVVVNNVDPARSRVINLRVKIATGFPTFACVTETTGQDATQVSAREDNEDARGLQRPSNGARLPPVLSALCGVHRRPPPATSATIGGPAIRRTTRWRSSDAARCGRATCGTRRTLVETTFATAALPNRTTPRQSCAADGQRGTYLADPPINETRLPATGPLRI